MTGDTVTSAKGTPGLEGRGLTVFGALALAAFGGAQAFGLLTSPPEAGMGHLQKIMYVHVPAAWSAFVAFFIVFCAGIVYLWRGDERADLLAASAAEVGAVLTALTLALGSIWAKPTWGVWWTWDPRLTLTAVLLVIFVGYLALRSFTDDFDRRARWSAAVGILGFLNVPLVYYSVRWWPSIHQVQSSPETVDPAYVWGLRLNGIAVLLVMLFFVWKRYRVARIRRAAESIEEERALEAGRSNV